MYYRGLVPLCEYSEYPLVPLCEYSEYPSAAAPQAPMYYRGASAAILVFDISKRDSFAVMKVRSAPRSASQWPASRPTRPIPTSSAPSRARLPLARAAVSRRDALLGGDEKDVEMHRAALP